MSESVGHRGRHRDRETPVIADWAYWVLLPFAVIGCWRVCTWIGMAIDRRIERKER